MTTRICKTCLEEKSLEDFVKSSKTPSGRTYKCKTCKNIARKNNIVIKECDVPSCTRLRAKSGSRYCSAHAYRKRIHGDVLDDVPIRDVVHGNGWHSYGYKYYYRPEHPNADKAGKVSEHTMIMSEYLGRPLLKHENVHHKNGVRDDNRLENLELWTESQPSGQRVEDKVAWAKEILAIYDPGALIA